MSEHMLAKAVVEKPKKNYYVAPQMKRYKNKLNQDIETPVYGVGKYWGWNRKTPSDHLAPLRGRLRKGVGKPWNEVWSQLCKQLPRGLMGEHVKSHVLAKHRYSGALVYPNHAVEHKDGHLYVYGVRSTDVFYIDDQGILRYKER